MLSYEGSDNLKCSGGIAIYIGVQILIYQEKTTCYDTLHIDLNLLTISIFLVPLLRLYHILD